MSEIVFQEVICGASNPITETIAAGHYPDLNEVPAQSNLFNNIATIKENIAKGAREAYVSLISKILLDFSLGHYDQRQACAEEIVRQVLES